MRKSIFLNLLFFLFVATEAFSSTLVDMSPFNLKRRVAEELPSSTRERILLNGEWRFYSGKGEIPEPASIKSIPESLQWDKVPIRVPSIFCYHPIKSFRYPERWYNTTYGWYEKDILIPSGWQKSKIVIHFDAVAYYTKVFFNSRFVGEHLGGYDAFDIDITDIAKLSKNNRITIFVAGVSLVKKTGTSTSGEWHTLPMRSQTWRLGGGIWQDVYLEKKPFLYVDNVYIVTSTRKKSIKVKTRIKNDSNSRENLQLSFSVFERDGKKVKEFVPVKVAMEAGAYKTVSNEYRWENPILWDMYNPHLYYLKTSITKKKKIIDEQFTRFGFREFWIEGPDFYLNGHKIRIKADWLTLSFLGNCLARPEYLRLLFSELKKAGHIGTRVDTLEVPSLIAEIADEVGLPITAHGYTSRHRRIIMPDEYLPQYRKEWRAYLEKYRNHPSIIIWSILNEPNKLDDVDLELKKMVKEIDPSRPVMIDSGNEDILNVHYTRNERWPFAKEMRFPQLKWKRDKPLIFGEFNCYQTLRSLSMMKFIGDKALSSIEERLLARAWADKMMGCSWRSYGISGIHPFAHVARGLFERMPWSPRNNSQLELKWDDLTTPYAKRAYMPEWFWPISVNPWVKQLPTVKPLISYNYYKDRIFAPLMITLSRSWEHNYYSQEEVEKRAFIVNDAYARSFANLTFNWTLSDKRSRVVLKGEARTFDLTEAEIKEVKFKFHLPEAKKRDVFTLRVNLTQGKEEMAFDDMEIDVFPHRVVSSALATKKVMVFDVGGSSKKIFEKSGIKVIPFDWGKLDIKKINLLIIGDHSLLPLLKEGDDIARNQKSFNQFITSGGTVLLLVQDTGKSFVPESFAFRRADFHPVFAGVSPYRLYMWKGEDGCLFRSWYDYPTKGRFRILLECNIVSDIDSFEARGTVLMEQFLGKGRIISSNLELVSRYGIDPEATRIFDNLLSYAAFPFSPPEKRVAYIGEESFLKQLKGDNFRAKSIVGITEITPEILKKYDILLIGENEIKPSSSVVQNASSIKKFVEDGGRVFCFAQDMKRWKDSWLPWPVKFKKVSKVTLCRKIGKDKLVEGLGFISTGKKSIHFMLDLRKNPLKLKSLFSSFSQEWKSLYLPCQYQAPVEEPYRHFQPISNSSILLKGSYGKGEYILCQLPVDTQKTSIIRVFNTLFTNLGISNNDGDNPIDTIFSQTNIGQGAAYLKRAKDKDWKGYYFIDIEDWCNMRFEDGEKEDKTGGWTDQGENDMRYLPVGDWIMDKIPFHIIDTSGELFAGRMKTCIVLKGLFDNDWLPQEALGIKINRLARRLHFLHTSAWTSNEMGKEIAHYVIHYQDKTVLSIPLKIKINISDWWWVKSGDLPQANVACVVKNLKTDKVGVYRMAWENPYPEKLIRSIDFISKGDVSVPILVAITGED